MIRVNLALAFLLLACSKSAESPAVESGPTPASPTEASRAAEEEARTTFNTLCSTCHGTSGQGDGIAAANLQPKPRNYTDKAWQASVTDDQIKQIILMGGQA